MKRGDEKGLTLIEMLIALAIMGMIAGAGSALLSSTIHAHQQGDARSSIYQEGLLAMERMTQRVRLCTYLLIPNAHDPTRDLLAVSGFTNDDNDYYFGDPLFPRIDEDPNEDMTDDGGSGVENADDDGDGSTDQGNFKDDDEDETNNEDPLDGADNDGDGLIDEDFADDAHSDGEPGIAGMDDDGDGTADEGSNSDDDEDGSTNEDPLNALLYLYDSMAKTLTESSPSAGQNVVLSNHVTNFQVTSGVTNCVLITLQLTADDGKSVTFSEYVYPRNLLQKTGKRVR